MMSVAIPGASDSRMKLSLHMKKHTAAAGDHVVGSVKVGIAKETEITAIRLHITGTEHTRYSDNSGDLDDMNTDESKQECYSQYVTLFGQTRASKESGKAFLAVGTYTYNFDVTLPPALLPSANFKKTGRSATVKYVVEARVVISRWVDTTVSEELQVLAAVPPHQLLQVLSDALPVGRFTGQDHRCGCHTSYSSSEYCFCGVKEREMVVVTLDVYPSVLVVHPSLPSGHPLPLPATLDPAIPLQPDANILTVRVGVENLLAEPIYKVEVSLVQIIRSKTSYTSRENAVVFGSTTYDARTGAGGAQPIAPQQSLVFDAVIPVRTNPFPSMKGKYIDSTTMLVVRIRGHNVPDVRAEGNIVIAGAVGSSDDVPCMPVTLQERIECEEIIT